MTVHSTPFGVAPSPTLRPDLRRRAMTRRNRRLAVIGTAGAVLAVALGLVLYAMSGTIVFFRSPTEVVASGRPGLRIRVGGLVEAGSLRREAGGHVSFAITDGNASVPVRYVGLLPDLFREGQGVVAEGALAEGGTFSASTVLARHDETYMPREVVDALKAQGRWQEGQDGRSPAPRAAPAR